MDTILKPTIWSTDRVRQAAHDILDLELSVGASTSDAMLAVVEGVIEAQSMEMLRNIRDWCMSEAEILDQHDEDGDYTDPVEALLYFARQLDDEIPMESRE